MKANYHPKKIDGESPQISQRVRRALELFPSLPDEALIEVRVVGQLLGRSSASVWRDVKNGRFCRPIKIGHSTRWRVGDVRAALIGSAGKAMTVEVTERVVSYTEAAR